VLAAVSDEPCLLVLIYSCCSGFLSLLKSGVSPCVKKSCIYKVKHELLRCSAFRTSFVNQFNKVGAIESAHWHTSVVFVESV
jgi:hypothetical protein